MAKHIDGVRNPIETMRTAPFPIAMTAASMVAPYVVHEILSPYVDGNTMNKVSLATVRAGEAAMYGVGIILSLHFATTAAGLVEKRNHTAQRIETHGFDAQHYLQTTKHWCNRQAMYATLEKHEHAVAYEALYKSMSSDMTKYRWLPHLRKRR